MSHNSGARIADTCNNLPLDVNQITESRIIKYLIAHNYGHDWSVN